MNKNNQFSNQDISCISKYALEENGALFLQFDVPVMDYEIEGAIARTFDEQYKPLKTVEKFIVSGKNVAWVDNFTKKIVVDSDYFSDLKMVDVTKLRPDEIVELGKVDKSIFTEWSSRDVVSFLLESQLLNTYWHTGAEVCLAQEQDSESRYRADFDATHTYFTNEKNVEMYTFGVQIDKASGAISIWGK